VAEANPAMVSSNSRCHPDDHTRLQQDPIGIRLSQNLILGQVIPLPQACTTGAILIASGRVPNSTKALN